MRTITCISKRTSSADDEIGRALRELLIRRRRQGIEVRVLYDAIGSVTTPAAFFEPMRQAGVEVLQFRPLNPDAHDAVEAQQPRSSQDRRRRRPLSPSPAASTSAARMRARRARGPGPKPASEEAWRDTHVQDRRTGGGAIPEAVPADLGARGRRRVDGGSAQYFPPLAPMRRGAGRGRSDQRRRSPRNDDLRHLRRLRSATPHAACG